jgi:hypothetical protein
MREIRTLRSMSGERKRDAGPLAHSSRASPRLYQGRMWVGRRLCSKLSYKLPIVKFWRREAAF